jgi:hypothetical protein
MSRDRLGGIDRRILQQELQRATGISDIATSGRGFDPRGGAPVLAAQLATAGIGAFAQNKARKQLATQELASQEDFTRANPEFGNIASQLSPEARENVTLKKALLQTQSRFAPTSDAALGGSTGVLVQRFMDSTGASFPDALAAVQGLSRRGLEIGEGGQVTPRAGLAESQEKLRTAETRGAGLGKKEAEVRTTLRSLKSKLPELERTVKDLSRLGRKATFTKAGLARDTLLRETGRPISKGGIARAEYIARVDNQILPLLRDTFGAAFTEREGETLKATLGAPNRSPKEKEAVLNAFIKQKRATIQSTARELGKRANEEIFSDAAPVQEVEQLTPTDLQNLSIEELQALKQRIGR